MAASKSFSNIISYELTRKIAEGGMEVFHEGMPRGGGHLEKRVSIKLIRDEDASVCAVRRDRDLPVATILPCVLRPKNDGRYQCAKEMMAGIAIHPNSDTDGPTSGKFGLYPGNRSAARPAPSEATAAQKLVGVHQGTRFS